MQNRPGRINGESSPVVASWCADSIVTAWVICPLWIAEIKQTIGQCEALQRSPAVCAREISAGFHDERKIGWASDVEPELIAAHTEIAVAGLDHRIPQYRRTTGKRRTPAGGA
jgi:hypothetical protein